MALRLTALAALPKDRFIAPTGWAQDCLQLLASVSTRHAHSTQSYMQTKHIHVKQGDIQFRETSLQHILGRIFML